MPGEFGIGKEQIRKLMQFNGIKVKESLWLSMDMLDYKITKDYTQLQAM